MADLFHQPFASGFKTRPSQDGRAFCFAADCGDGHRSVPHHGDTEKKGPKCDLPPAPGPVELQYTSRNICGSAVTAVLDICIVSSCSEQPWRTENQIVQESNRSVWVFVIE